MQRDQMDAVIDLAAAMEKLTEKQRQAIKLWVLGYTQQEIAGIIGVSQPAVVYLIERAEAVLREGL